MADEATGASTESPAAVAQEPASPFAEAKAELVTLQSESATPAAKAQDTPAEGAPADDDTDDAGTEGDQPAGSRRQRGEQMRIQIEREVREKLDREQTEARDRERASVDGKAYQDLLDRVESGSYEAAQQLAKLHRGQAHIRDGAVVETQPTEVAETHQARGRQAVLAELAADFNNIRGKLDGATDADYEGLMKAPSIEEYGKRAFEIGRKPLLERITTLETENRSLRGRLTGAAPSPIGANGAGRGAPPPATGMRAIFEQVKAEAEARP